MSSSSSNAPQTNTNNPSTPQSQTPSGFANYFGTPNALYPPQIPNFSPQQSQHILNTFLTQQPLPPQYPQYPQQMFNPEQYAMHQQLLSQTQSFLPQTFPTQQTQTPQEIVPETQEIVQETDDVVEVTAARRSTSKKKKTCVKVAWTEKEEELLAEMWCSVSEDERLGNAQPGPRFWIRIVEGYNTEAAKLGLPERGKESLNSKFTVMSALVKDFIGHHAEAVRCRGSGTDDHAVYKAARQMYLECEKSTFRHDKAWEIWREHSRWRSFVKIDPPLDIVNLDDVGVGDDIFADDVEQRPQGKKRGSKRKESSDASDKAQTSSSSTLCGLIASHLKKITKTKKQTAEIKAKTLHRQEQAAMRQEQAAIRQEEAAYSSARRDDMMFLQQSTEGMPPAQAAWVEAEKIKILEKYGMN